MWTAIKTSDGEVHVLPMGDRVSHWADEFCLCMPSRQFQGNVFGAGGHITTHNSYDGREAGEGPLRDSAPGNLASWSTGTTMEATV